MEYEIRHFSHLKIPLRKIRNATNNFSDKNIIGKGSFGKVYRGTLLHKGKKIKIAARRLDQKNRHGYAEFWTEISSLYCFQTGFHPDCLILIGYCDEKGENIVINRHFSKGSLSRYISDPLTLNLKRRLDIAMFVCVQVKDMHNVWLGAVNASRETKETGDYIIHRNINSSTILLNKYWMPSLSGFEYSIKHLKERRNEFVNLEVIGTKGYIDPAIEKYGGVNHKTDIYSLGIVLFELLCGRKAFEETKLLGPLVKFHYEHGTMKDIMHPDLWNQIKPESFKCFSEAAYSCLQEDPKLRPDSYELSEQIEEAVRLQDLVQKHEMKERPIFENLLEISSPDVWKVKVEKWEHLRIELTHIHSPPPSDLERNAHYTFKQEIEYYNKEYVSFLEQKNKDDLPKKRHIVEAKLILYQEDAFLSEIEILGRCMHPNIQSFLGFYHNGNKMMLFYEYVSDKSLINSLRDGNLSWEKRLKICIDIAHGLDYIHNKMEEHKMVIHNDLHIGKIIVDDTFVAKIIGFEKSLIVHLNQSDDSIRLENEDYVDSDYVETGKINQKSSDVFSFGIIMFNILCGLRYYDIKTSSKISYDIKRSCYVVRYDNTSNNTSILDENDTMAIWMRDWCENGTIKENLASPIKEENYGNRLFLKKGPNEDSLDTFINIAYKCLKESRNQRPKIEVVVKELKKALTFHENHKDPLRMSFNDIKSATRDFDRANCIGGGGFGQVYKGKLAHESTNKYSTIVVKKLDKSQGQGEKHYYNELEILCEYMHENIIGLIGYSDETNEKLIVYEHASKGSLDRHLKNDSLTWKNRLKICMDVATGLNFLHECIQGQRVVIHRDIKTANILLFDDWKAKLGDFGLSMFYTMNEEAYFAVDRPCGTEYYVDPMYFKSGILNVKSDVYSFGVVLFEILSGKEVYSLLKHERQSLLSYLKQKFSLISVLKQKFKSKKHNEAVFEAISEEIVPSSLTTFLNIVYACLNENRDERPTTTTILTELKKALKFQEEKNEN